MRACPDFRKWPGFWAPSKQSKIDRTGFSRSTEEKPSAPFVPTSGWLDCPIRGRFLEGRESRWGPHPSGAAGGEAWRWVSMAGCKNQARRGPNGKPGEKHEDSFKSARTPGHNWMLKSQ